MPHAPLSRLPPFPASCRAQDALCGSILPVHTLDGRTLSVGLTEVIRPGYVKVVPGEGMPVPQPPAGSGKSGAAVGAAGPTGDLRIEFELIFPERLTPKQRQAVRAIKM